MTDTNTLLGKELVEQEFEKLKKQLPTDNWTAGEEACYFWFFLHGWHARNNEAQFQKMHKTEAVKDEN